MTEVCFDPTGSAALPADGGGEAGVTILTGIKANNQPTKQTNKQANAPNKQTNKHKIKKWGGPGRAGENLYRCYCCFSSVKQTN